MNKLTGLKLYHKYCESAKKKPINKEGIKTHIIRKLPFSITFVIDTTNDKTSIDVNKVQVDASHWCQGSHTTLLNLDVPLAHYY